MKINNHRTSSSSLPERFLSQPTLGFYSFFSASSLSSFISSTLSSIMVFSDYLEMSILREAFLLLSETFYDCLLEEAPELIE